MPCWKSEAALHRLSTCSVYSSPRCTPDALKKNLCSQEMNKTNEFIQN
jgi:hypothetical protein